MTSEASTRHGIEDEQVERVVLNLPGGQVRVALSDHRTGPLNDHGNPLLTKDASGGAGA